MFNRSICIHGHFYQPPREDPWLGEVLPEGSAAPGRDWNERILEESYAPLANARLLDDQGRIRRLMNCYELMSFNFGPTLLGWMERTAPETYARILDADRASRDRLGFGNAMAQIRHHIIMPLATEDEKRIETAWAVQDFEARYGRTPDGLWLPEAAADTASLEALAEAGIAYTVLAPRQAAAVADPGGDWMAVDEGGLDISCPYRMELPSGRSIAIFFYHGGLSQAVAFERLLEDGGAFWNRVREATGDGLTSLATDGETYGHHFKFGEMALAYLLDSAMQDDEVHVTNYAAHLAANPPERLVRLREPSSWSCVHGVERWRADCGCKTGEHQDWNQRWRGPLRDALDGLKERIDAHYAKAAPLLMRDPASALADYGRILAPGADAGAFAAQHFDTTADAATAWGLLAMQRHAHAAYASCAWFFDDLDRIEPINALSNALRAAELAAATGIDGGASPIEAALAESLSRARSNPTQAHPQGRPGDAVLREEAAPRRGSPEALVLHALMLAWAEGAAPDAATERHWPSVSVRVEPQRDTAAVSYATGEQAVELSFEWEAPAPDAPWAARLRREGGDWLAASDLPWNKRQDILMAWAEARAEAAWNDLAAEAATARALVLPHAESQRGQNRAEQWERLLPPLAVAFIAHGGDTARDATVTRLLAESDWAQPALDTVSRRINRIACGLLEEGRPDWDAVERLARRAEECGVAVDWRAAQNRAWALRDETPEAARALRALGFA